ncbi:uncharacterized protein TNCV_4661241 [Trichonephila clavipes]|uniref:Transposase n=1 Tax=Trichonephila clavipes TaxID=2585209 RepID=A0A8X6V8K3_TRICX|nr:uncharacterized protein TNCV_4661241 [Trichonephila clavipes]
MEIAFLIDRVTKIFCRVPLARHPCRRFQQDGATCHTARATIDLLKDTFGDRLISRFGPVNWPPRSCDLTPLDYFLWGYVKSLVYANKPQTLDHLEDSIRRVIADIQPQMVEKVIENWTSRLYYIQASRGSPMPEIIFKISLECLLGIGALDKIKFSGQSQVPPSGEETIQQIYIEAIGFRLFGATLKSDTTQLPENELRLQWKRKKKTLYANQSSRRQKREKGDKGRNRDVAKTCFIAVTVKFDCAVFFLRQGYLRMSEQRDLPESMAWRVIGRLESGQTQRSVADTVGVARSVVARMWNRFKETGNVKRRPGAGRPRATT